MKRMLKYNLKVFQHSEMCIVVTNIIPIRGFVNKIALDSYRNIS